MYKQALKTGMIWECGYTALVYTIEPNKGRIKKVYDRSMGGVSEKQEKK